MVTRLRNYCRAAFFLCLLALISFSCQPEDVINQNLEIETSQRFIVKTLNKKEVEADKNLMEKLNKLAPKTQKGSDKDLSREIYIEEYDFIIDTDFVRLIEDSESNYRSYNFPLSRENPEDDRLENLLLSTNADGGYDAHIVKYDFTSEELATIDEAELASRTTVYTLIDFDTSIFTNELARDTPNEICVEVWLWSNTGNTDEGELVGAGNEGQETYGWVLGSRECTWISGSGGTSTAGTGDTASNGNTTNTCNTCGANGPNGNENTVTYTYVSAPTPTAPDVKVLLPEILNITDPAIMSWLNNKFNKADATAVYNLLNEYNCAVMNATSITACDNVLFQANEILAILSTNPDFDYEEAVEFFVFGELVDEIVVGPDLPIENMEEYLSCFDTSGGSQTANITIYVDEPVNGSNALVGADGVGHAFISIEQGSNIATFGFYPVNGLPSLFVTVNGVMGNNSNTAYDVSLTINNITPSTLQAVINNSIGFANLDYNLHWTNCTDFGINIGNLVGLPVPNCNADPIYFFGSTPGRLGEYMRSLSLPEGVDRNIIGGFSPSNYCDQ